MIYGFIQTHGEYPVTRWATYFGVSTSGYYDWRVKLPVRCARETAYADEVEHIFRESHSTYGANRIGAMMRRKGHTASFDKITRIMKDRGLCSVHVRRTRPLTDSRKARGDEYLNLLRGREITAPFEAISSDITYIPTAEGFDYLCQIKDIASGVILAACQRERMTKELVLSTIRAAHKRWHLPEGCIFHSDRGSQYTSKEVIRLIATLNIRQSFSRVGMPGDNAWSESFFSTLKKEAVHGRRFNTREQARQTLFSFIEVFYNRLRIQKRLGFLSPLHWLQTFHSIAA